MTDTLIAVVKDLWDFLWQKETVVVPTTPRLPVVDQTPLHLPEATKPQLVLPSAPAIELLQSPKQSVVEGLYGDTAYVLTPEAKAFHRPVWTFDGVVKVLPYATPVSILGYEGRFARVANDEGSLFILKDELTTTAEDIFADFQIGEIYSANHPDTKKVRAMIHDEFFTAELCMPLLNVEFVMYQLQLVGRSIAWKSTRPRLAGQWQNLLKGQMGIQMGIMPKTGALIEYTKPDGSGFLGYTKAVHVDESIVIEGVGRLIEGEYRKEALTKEEWHELRPVWISVT